MHSIIAQRLVNQQLEQPRFQTPGEVVNWLGAVQAQEYAGAVWSLGLRLPGARKSVINQAFDDGELLRTHALRPTWHFVMPADIRWILDLTAPRVHAANGYWYRKFELDDTLFSRSAEVLRTELQGQPRTRAELAAALARVGIQAGGLRLGYLMMHAELEQLICSGPRRGKQFTYMLLDERVPPGNPVERDAALAELTRRFFTSHGPALIQDFVGWSGLTIADARAGLHLAGSQLSEQHVDGKHYWNGVATAAPGATSNAYLLPQYDELFSGYKDYSAFMDSRHAEQARTAAFFNVVMVDGRLVGNWRRTIKGRTILVETAPWRAWSAAEQDACAAAGDRLGAFVGLPVKWN